MNRIDFMERLAALLKDLPSEEKEEAMQYYKDYFDDAGVENEASLIQELGSPEKVAISIKAGLRGRDDASSEYSENGYTDTRFEEKNIPVTAQNARTSSAQDTKQKDWVKIA